MHILYRFAVVLQILQGDAGRALIHHAHGIRIVDLQETLRLCLIAVIPELNRNLGCGLRIEVQVVHQRGLHLRRIDGIQGHVHTAGNCDGVVGIVAVAAAVRLSVPVGKVNLSIGENQLRRRDVLHGHGSSHHVLVVVLVFACADQGRSINRITLATLQRTAIQIIVKRLGAQIAVITLNPDIILDFRGQSDGFIGIGVEPAHELVVLQLLIHKAELTELGTVNQRTVGHGIASHRFVHFHDVPALIQLALDQRHYHLRVFPVQIVVDVVERHGGSCIAGIDVHQGIRRTGPTRKFLAIRRGNAIGRRIIDLARQALTHQEGDGATANLCAVSVMKVELVALPYIIEVKSPRRAARSGHGIRGENTITIIFIISQDILRAVIAVRLHCLVEAAVVVCPTFIVRRYSVVLRRIIQEVI